MPHSAADYSYEDDIPVYAEEDAAATDVPALGEYGVDAAEEEAPIGAYGVNGEEARDARSRFRGSASRRGRSRGRGRTSSRQVLLSSFHSSVLRLLSAVPLHGRFCLGRQ